MPLPARHPARAAVVLLLLAACSEVRTPTEQITAIDAPMATARSGHDPAIVQLVRQLAVERGIPPMPKPERIREPLVSLGRMLLFDPILSGNKNISCGTCHFPTIGTGDGKSLSIGEGGTGLGATRSHPEGVFIPRNAPPLYNLGVMKHLFWDGRIEQHGRSIITPAGAQVTPEMARVFEFGSISAIGMFPVTNRAEMRGTQGNELAAIDDADNPAIWRALMKRLGAIPEYRRMFEHAYPGTPFREMSFAHASNAIGAFIVDQFTFSNTPWDRFLRGRDNALSDRQLEGAKTFLTLKCSICHSGPTLSDDKFHNVAVAQVGPGLGDGSLKNDDFGRMRVTGNPADRYLFRTTPLRNVELTAPYGHSGSILELREFIEHYSESDLKLRAFDASPLEALLRGTLVSNADAILATRDTLLQGVVLTDELVASLMDFMGALTDDDARHAKQVVPRRVPSGLPVDREK